MLAEAHGQGGVGRRPLIWNEGNSICKGQVARENTVPWGSPIVFGLVKAESGRWSMGRGW